LRTWLQHLGSPRETFWNHAVQKSKANLTIWFAAQGRPLYHYWDIIFKLNTVTLEINSSSDPFLLNVERATMAANLDKVQSCSTAPH
jgi:hypothetical protein